MPSSVLLLEDGVFHLLIDDFFDRLLLEPSASISRPVSRLGEGGYGARRYGSFAGKGSAAHPVGVITRLSADGYGARRYSSFAGKTASVATHGIVSRLGEGGYGVRRYSSFAGKTASTGTATTKRRPILFIANVGRLMN